MIATAIALAAFGVWIFRPGTNGAESSIPRVILSDRATLGFVRLLAAAASLYGLASITVLVMRGRWARSISTTGIEADATEDPKRTIRALEDELRRALSQRDEANRLLSRLLDG